MSQAQLCENAGLGSMSAEIINAFKQFDADDSGSIDAKELTKALKAMGENPTASEVAKQIKEVDADNSGQIEFSEFLTVINNIRAGKDSAFGRTVQKKGDLSLNVLKSEHGGTHSFSDEEKQAFVEYINDCLGKDPDCSHFMPLDPSDMSLFPACRDGILLCKLINIAVPGTIDERVINKANKSKGVLSPRGQNVSYLNVHQSGENLWLGVNSAKGIGCVVTNVGASDILECREHVILGLIWQVIRIGLLSQINLAECPELVKLLEPGETLADLMKLPPDQILMRWVNYHMKNAGDSRRIKNFSSDIKDSHVYTVLLHQIAPKDKNVNKDALKITDDTKRAAAMLVEADKIGCKRFVKPSDVVNGNSKLNLAFVANLFNMYPALGELTEAEKNSVDEALFNGIGSREARAFALWINSLGVDPFVNNLFEDLRDGLVILRVMDAIRPKTVDWTKVVTKVPLNKFQKIANLNYALTLGKDPFKFSLVGIGGQDLEAGNEKLTLGLVWQMMRYQVVSVLSALGPNVGDDQIINWANNKVKASGKSTKISSFKDDSLVTSHFFLDLLNAIRSGFVDQSLITPGDNEKDRMMNAKYTISLARKMGCSIFLLPEDILEKKDKMIMTLVASIMSKGM